MKWVLGGITASTGAVLGIPALISSFSPTIKYDEGKKRWRPLGKIEHFPVGGVTPAQVETCLDKEDFINMAMPKAVYVWRESEDKLTVFSRSCTDLGCPVNYDPGSECYFCPCHGGIFSKEGLVMKGPPKGPLYQYKSRLVDGFLEIDLASVPIVA